MTTIVRAQVAHAPPDPFAEEAALEAFSDGAPAVSDPRVVALGSRSHVRSGHPEAEVLDARDAFAFPGFVDCHVHYPQIRVIGALGLELMDRLRRRSLPEEARLVGEACAVRLAERGESVGRRLGARIGALFTLARDESITEVRVAGRVVLSGAGA